MNNKAKIVASILVVSVGAAALYVSHARQDLSATPTASSDQPVPSAGSSVRPAASALTVVAASAMSSQARMADPKISPPEMDDYNTTKKCYYDSDRAVVLRRIIGVCEELTKQKSVGHSLDNCAKDLDKNSEALSKLDSELKSCPSSSQLASNYYKSAKQMAKRGDADAQLCYLESRFMNGNEGIRYSADDSSDYQADAPRYIDNAFARGDWRVVKLLGTEHLPTTSSLLPLIVKGDPYTAYKMNRLLRLGADGGYGDMLDKLANAHFLTPRMTSGPALAPEQIAQANAEAQELYNQHFRSSPRLTKAPTVCADSEQ